MATFMVGASLVRETLPPFTRETAILKLLLLIG
jgi:hypothetical protein